MAEKNLLENIEKLIEYKLEQKLDQQTQKITDNVNTKLEFLKEENEELTSKILEQYSKTEKLEKTFKRNNIVMHKVKVEEKDHHYLERKILKIFEKHGKNHQ